MNSCWRIPNAVTPGSHHEARLARSAEVQALIHGAVNSALGGLPAADGHARPTPILGRNQGTGGFRLSPHSNAEKPCGLRSAPVQHWKPKLHAPARAFHGPISQRDEGPFFIPVWWPPSAPWMNIQNPRSTVSSRTMEKLFSKPKTIRAPKMIRKSSRIPTSIHLPISAPETLRKFPSPPKKRANRSLDGWLFSFVSIAAKTASILKEAG